MASEEKSVSFTVELTRVSAVASVASLDAKSRSHDVRVLRRYALRLRVHPAAARAAAEAIAFLDGNNVGLAIDMLMRAGMALERATRRASQRRASRARLRGIEKADERAKLVQARMREMERLREPGKLHLTDMTHKLYADMTQTERVCELAEEFGVNESTILRALKRKC